MKENIIIIALLYVFFILFCVFGFIGYEDGYEVGQIDAINGVIRYELITHPDQTKVWVKIDNPPKE